MSDKKEQKPHERQKDVTGTEISEEHWNNAGDELSDSQLENVSGGGKPRGRPRKNPA